MSTDNSEFVSPRSASDLLLAAEARAAVAEARLRHLETVIDIGAIGLFDWPDVSTEAISLSETFLQGLGYPPNSFAGTREAMASLVHPDDLPAVVENFAVGTAEHTHRKYTCRLLLASGAYRWHETNLKGYQRPGQATPSAIATIVDVHDATTLRIKNATLVEQLNAVVEASGAGVYDWPDSADTYLEISPSLQRLINLEGQEVPQDFDFLWERIHPEDRHQVGRDLAATSVDPNGAFDSTYRLLVEGKGYRYVRSLAQATFIDGGPRHRLTGAIFDIHDAQMAIRAEAAVREQLSQFNYIVAHDLAAPLRQLSGYTTILAEDYGSLLDQQAHAHLATMEATAQNAQLLIRDLLAFSQVGTAAMRFQRVDLQPIVDHLIEMLDPRREINWRCDPMPTVNGDRTHLTMLFQNLLANAVKFSGKTGRQATITIASGETDGTMVQIRVADNGIGFDQSYAEKIFGAFERAHSKDEFEGSGIGLANVARIVERHNGTITAEGRPGYGATFHVSLPR